jgi:hypothetical protein
LKVRLFRPDDEERLRAICYETGFFGRPVTEWIDANQPLFTDIWLYYYLHCEPESTFVVEYRGRVVGYLTGCVDDRRQKRFMRTGFVVYFLKSWLSGRYRMGWRTMAMLGRMARDAVVYGFPRKPPDCHSHSHLNVSGGHRGLQLLCGVKLHQAWFARLWTRGHVRTGSLLAMSREDLDKRRLRSIVAVYDKRRTTIYRNADPRELYIATVEANETQPHWQRCIARFDVAAIDANIRDTGKTGQR